MNRIIRKIAVLGAGTMGTRLACHFANTGLEVLLLGRGGENPTADKTPISSGSIEKKLTGVIESLPAPLFRKEYRRKIKTGNIEKDFSGISDCDWILESVAENIHVKKDLLAKADGVRKPGALVTTNTSGISINALCEGRSEDFRRHFCGTHFFNPPRYLRLLEIVPSHETNAEVIEFLADFGDRMLGKKTIVCRDTPAFIANRIGVYHFLDTVNIMIRLGLSIDEVDKLTGPVAGRPKSATFRTSDIVGLDVLADVASGLQQRLPAPENETFALPELISKMISENILGEKSQKGFYKKAGSGKEKSRFLTLDYKNFEYRPRKKIRFKTLFVAGKVAYLKDRLPVLYNGKDIAGEFYRLMLNNLFCYVSNLVPGTNECFFKIDDAVCAGFGWELGPFEIWEAIGTVTVLKQMEAAGIKAAQWVYEMQDSGIKTFYQTENGIKKYYDLREGRHLEIPGQESFLILENIRAGKQVWQNPGCSLIDLGEGILDIEFHNKMNILGRDVMEGIRTGIETAEKDFRGVVIGNNGPVFTAGADLGMVFMLAIEQAYDELGQAIKMFQDTVMRLRYSSIPVVLAPHDLTLGGGCEMSLHADHIQAAAETYVGLVEANVGLIPGGGGSKELTRKISGEFHSAEEQAAVIQIILKNIILASVSTSADEAFDMHYFGPGTGITMNRDRLLSEAKSAAIKLAESGYKMPDREITIRVAGRPGMTMFENSLEKIARENTLTDHDRKIARKVSWIMCGGDLPAPENVTEDYLLGLEKEAFLSLCGERKTLERINAIIRGRKAPRN